MLYIVDPVPVEQPLDRNELPGCPPLSSCPPVEFSQESCAVVVMPCQSVSPNTGT